MIFLLNTDFNEKFSVIEPAELERARVFQQFHQFFQFLIRDWNPQLHSILNDCGLHDDEFVNLFDFYQGTTSVVPHAVSAQEIDFGLSRLDYQEDLVNSRYLVKRDKQLVGRINLFAESDMNEQSVQAVEQFDMYGNLYKVDYYDERGFISRSQWFSSGQQIETECWCNLDGVPVLESFNQHNVGGHFDQFGWRLYKRDGAMYSFDTFDALYLEFVNDMNSQAFNPSRPNVIFFNRPDMVDQGLPEWRQPAYTVMNLYGAQGDGGQNSNRLTVESLDEQFRGIANSYDSIVTATDSQRHYFVSKFQSTAKLLTIPGGTVSKERLTAARMPTRARRIGSTRGVNQNRAGKLVMTFTLVKRLAKRRSDTVIWLSKSAAPLAAVWQQWEALLADATCRWPAKLAEYRGPIVRYQQH